MWRAARALISRCYTTLGGALSPDEIANHLNFTTSSGGIWTRLRNLGCVGDSDGQRQRAPAQGGYRPGGVLQEGVAHSGHRHIRTFLCQILCDRPAHAPRRSRHQGHLLLSALRLSSINPQPLARVPGCQRPTPRPPAHIPAGSPSPCSSPEHCAKALDHPGVGSWPWTSPYSLAKSPPRR
jgi:hypothetical protein